MPTPEERLTTLEKDSATMKRDIAYYLDDLRNGVFILRGVIGKQGQDIKYLSNQVKGLDIRLEGTSAQLDGLELEVKSIKGLQEKHGQDIQLLKADVSAIKSLVETHDQKFDQVLQILTMLVNK